MSRQPLVDLAAQYREVRDELLPEIERLMASGAFVGGEAVTRFESSFAALCGAPHAVGVANGTDALHLALRALGVGPGDEVVTVPNTFVATVEAIVHAGARPVLVDVRPDTLVMDVAALDGARTSRTRAVIPVHLYGRLVEVEPIERWCATRAIALLEDAAQAHGARYRGRSVGAPAGAPVPSATPPRSASTRPRTWVLPARRAPSSRGARTSPRAWRGCAITARASAITTTWSATTAGSTRCRPRCCR